MKLFPGIEASDIRRPVGDVEVLLGLDCCRLLPDKIAESDNLQLVNGSLGYCLRGSHSSIKTDRKQEIKAQVHFTSIDTNDNLRKYFETENLGTLLSSLCRNCHSTCDTSSCNENITIKEGKELDMIKNGLSYDEEIVNGQHRIHG